MLEQDTTYQSNIRKTRALFKDAGAYLCSSRIDESILDNFDELDTPSAVSQISKDVTGEFQFSAIIVLHVKSGLTASYTNLRMVTERLYEVCSHSRLFKGCLISSVVMKTEDSNTKEDVIEELDPNNIPDGYKVLSDFLKKHDRAGLALHLPDAEIAFDVSFSPAQLSFEKYAQYMRKFIDSVSTIVTRNDKDTGHLTICSYDVQDKIATIKFFEYIKPKDLADAYNLIYLTDIKSNEEIEKKIHERAKQQFNRQLPQLLLQSVELNKKMENNHGVWIEYLSANWIWKHSLLIRAHVRQRYDDEPLSVSNILFTLTRTLFIYIPDSILTSNAICVSVTADETIADVNNKVPSLGLPGQTRFDENILINTGARSYAMNLTDGKKEVYNNHFVRVTLSRGDEFTAGMPVGVIFPLKNGHVSKNWYNLKIKYSGSLRHDEWFQPFLEIDLNP